jgi:competence protein ComGC
MMRAVFGIISLLLVLLIVSSLVKKQMAATIKSIPALQVPGNPAPANAANASATALEQAQQIKQQVEALQAPRPLPEDVK